MSAAEYGDWMAYFADQSQGAKAPAETIVEEMDVNEFLKRTGHG